MLCGTFYTAIKQVWLIFDNVFYEDRYIAFALCGQKNGSLVEVHSLHRQVLDSAFVCKYRHTTFTVRTQLTEQVLTEFVGKWC